MQLLLVGLSVLFASSSAARGADASSLLKSEGTPLFTAEETAARAFHAAHADNFGEDSNDDIVHLRLFRFAKTDRFNRVNNTNFGDLAWVCHNLWAGLPYGRFLNVWDVKVHKKMVYGTYKRCNWGECVPITAPTYSAEFGIQMKIHGSSEEKASGCSDGDRGLLDNDALYRWYSLEVPHRHSRPSQDDWTDPHEVGIADVLDLFPEVGKDHRVIPGPSAALFPNNLYNTSSAHTRTTPNSLDVIAARLEDTDWVFTA